MLSLMNSEERKHAEARLNALREEILNNKELAAEDKSPVELDQSRVGRLSRMDAMQQQAMSMALDRRRDTQLKRIEGAFIRLEKGVYGDCVRCKKPIDAKRMEFDPTAFYCVECAAIAEKR